MKLALQATLSFGLLALCLATSSVRWCTISNEEQEKCIRLQQECFAPQQSKELPVLNCVRKADPHDCIRAIKSSEADAVTLDAGHIAEAGLSPNNLKPIVAEVHMKGSKETTTNYHAIAVIKKGVVSSLEDLQGKKSCHTGFERSAGWDVPVGTLLYKNILMWDGVEAEPVEKAVGRFFIASCVPGVKEVPSLCRLCSGKCDWNDPYVGYSGAFECLKSGGGEVAFVNDATVLALSPEERSKYQLLCLDGSAKPIEEYESCFWAQVAAHAVVARPVDGRADEIRALLFYALEQAKQGQATCQLFGSPHDTGKDLLFKDSAISLVPVPELMDAQLYVGAKHYASIQNLRRERSKGVTGKGYIAVAVAKRKDTDINWNTLKGKKSCHTSVGRTAGWNIPMGLIYTENNRSCDFDKFFSESCAPGAPPESSLCALCKGSGGEGSLSQKYKCKPNSNEIYYGYKGAFRCLVEVGDVAFIKHSIISEVIEGENKPAWAAGLSASDFVLLSLHGERCRHDEYDRCNLATVSNHAVVSRPERAERVKMVLLEQQKMFGRHGNQTDDFQMFQSEAKDSLFKDGTECLAVPNEKTYKTYLGESYVNSVDGISKCSSSELLKVCNFHSHD
uniref:Ovotransferrin-like n=1 Tax=Ailuropoda melanoleuca TaxID=9646 RepID=A0A7N5P1R2_AILME